MGEAGEGRWRREGRWEGDREGEGDKQGLKTGGRHKVRARTASEKKSERVESASARASKRES